MDPDLGKAFADFMKEHKSQLDMAELKLNLTLEEAQEVIKLVSQLRAVRAEQQGT